MFSPHEALHDTWRILSYLKDRISDDDKSSIVYKINCHDVMPAM